MATWCLGRKHRHSRIHSKENHPWLREACHTWYNPVAPNLFHCGIFFSQNTCYSCMHTGVCWKMFGEVFGRVFLLSKEIRGSPG